jgi:hypothetical protein
MGCKHCDEQQLAGRPRQEHHVGSVVLAGMAATLQTIDAHRIAADRFGFERVTPGSALVNDFDARSLERRAVAQKAMALKVRFRPIRRRA